MNNKDNILDKSLYTNIIKLSGDWEFSYGEFLYSEDFTNVSGIEDETIISDFAKDWHSLRYNPSGKATYRKVLENNSTINDFAIKIDNVYYDYKLYINGKRVKAPDINNTSSKTNFDSDYHFFSTNNIDSKKIEIIIHIQNKEFLLRGLGSPPLIASNENMIIYKEILFAFSIMSIFILSILSFVMLIIYLVNKKNNQMLLLYTSAIFYTLKIMLTSKGSYGISFSGESLFHLKQIFFVLDLLSIIFLFYYLKPLLKDKKVKFLNYIIYALFFTVSLSILMTTNYFKVFHIAGLILSTVGIIYIFLILSLDILTSNSDAISYFTSVLIITIFFPNDILILNISKYRLISFILFYIFAIFHALKKGSNNINDLLKIQTNLEEEVAEQSFKLKKLFIQLEKEKESRVVAEKNLVSLSSYDIITGFYNKTYGESYIQKQIQMYNRYGHSFSIMIVEINELPYIKETFDIKAINLTIRETLIEINSVIRSSDQISNWSEDRFLILIHSCKEKNYTTLINKINTLLEEKVIKDIGKISISHGITSITKNDTINSIIYRLEVSLTRNK